MDRNAASRTVSTLFEEWYPFLLRYATRLCGSVTLAEEAVQETLLALYEALQMGQNIGNHRAWTLCVVRRKLGALRTADSRARLFGRSLEDEFDEPAMAEPLVDGLEWDQLQRMFSNLTARETEVLLLRLQPMRYGEIADALGITKASVSTLLMRAVRKLRKACGLNVGAAMYDLETDTDGHKTLQRH